MSVSYTHLAIPELFALVPKGTKAEIPDGYTVIPTPTDRVICMTTPQLAGFKMCIRDRYQQISNT